MASTPGSVAKAKREVPLGIGRVGSLPAGIAGAWSYWPASPDSLVRVPSAITGILAPNPYLETSTERQHADEGEGTGIVERWLSTRCGGSIFTRDSR